MITEKQQKEIFDLLSELCLKTGISTTRSFNGISDGDDVIRYLKVIKSQIPAKRYADTYKVEIWQI